MRYVSRERKNTLGGVPKNLQAAILTWGRQNTVNKGPQPLFAQKALVPLCITGFSPFMAHHNISLRFRVGARREENFHFSLISISLW